jgi:hypothetical protein
MNINEIKEKIIQNVDYLQYSSSYTSGLADKPYVAKKLIQLRETINELSDIQLILPEIAEIKKTSLFSSFKDEDYFTSNENLILDSNIYKIRTGLSFLLRYKLQIETPEHGLYLKLPEIINFDDLAKVANDLKKAIEMPIVDQNDGGYVQIKSAESGSIWLIISVGTFSGVNLVAAICWASAVIRKKKAEAKIYEEHAKTLELKNEVLESILDAQKQQYKNILQAEAEQIANNHFNNQSPEVIERLKLSLTTVSELIDRGAQILPSSDKELTKSFPNYSNLDLIESAIKKIASN